ncbi:MAG: ABC transporter permease subunit [Ignavibacteriae bacterium]|nr:ABC transporter permease subunit [Ignavibacteriota bacterium]
MFSRKIKDDKTEQKVLSIMQRRWRKFKGMKRGYNSFRILVIAYILSFCLPVLVNNQALMVSYNGHWTFPAVQTFFAELPVVGLVIPNHAYPGVVFGQKNNTSECKYRDLKVQYQNEGQGNFVVMPLYPYGYKDMVAGDGVKEDVFTKPLGRTSDGGFRLFGTDDSGGDVFSKIMYGFNISISFALLLSFIEYLIGIPLGATLGYLGGWFDILMQRIIEIWASLPLLFLIIIVVSILTPSFGLLLGLLSVASWVGITTYVRAEFYREKAKDYVAAAVSIGIPTWKIMLKHILPNSLVPLITFFPFTLIGGITALVSLDFLGFGLPPGTPSWGSMISIGLDHINDGYWWLTVVPLTAMFLTLMMTVFIGEAIREAFDPKVFSRLR